MGEGEDRIRQLLQEQQWVRSLQASDEAIGAAFDDSPLSATVQGYSGGRMLLQFPGSGGVVPAGQQITSGGIVKGESVLIDQGQTPTFNVEGIPWVRPQVEAEELVVEVSVFEGAIAVLYRKRVEDNWQYYVAGLTPEAIAIGEPIPILRETRTFTFDKEVTVRVEAETYSEGGSFFFIRDFTLEDFTATAISEFRVDSSWVSQSDYYLSIACENDTATTELVGISGRVASFSDFGSGPSTEEPPINSVQSLLSFTFFMEEWDDSEERSGVDVVTPPVRYPPFSDNNDKIATYQNSGILIEDGRAFLAYGPDEVPTRVTAEGDVVATFSYTQEWRSLYANDGWISYENGVFYVGIRWDYGTEFDNVNYYQISPETLSVTELSLDNTGDYQERNLDGALQDVEAGAEEVTFADADFFGTVPSSLSPQGLLGLDPGNLDIGAIEILGDNDINCPNYWSKTGTDYYCLNKIRSFNDAVAGELREVEVAKADPESFEVIETYLIPFYSWDVLNPESYLSVDFDGVTTMIGDFVFGLAIAPPQ